MKPFEEQDRFNYPDLTPNSLVIDGGGFEGNWANQIAVKYGCAVVCYEPTRAFYQNILGRLARGEIHRDIVPVHAALGCSDRKELFGVMGDHTGIACLGNSKEEVRIVDVILAVDGWMQDFDVPEVAVLKLNVESMEYEILERLIESGRIGAIRHLQVQPHNLLPGHAGRWAHIRELLLLTHDLTFDEPWIWTGFSLRK